MLRQSAALSSGLRRRALVGLAIALVSLVGRVSQAQEAYQALIELQQQYDVQLKAQKFDQAEKIAREIVRRAERDFADNPKVLTTCLIKLGTFLREQGQLEESEQLCRRVVVIWQEAAGQESQEYLDAVMRVAHVVEIRGRYDDAGRLYKLALALSEKMLGPEHADTAEALTRLAFIYRAQGQSADAEPLLRRALAISAKIDGRESLFYAGRLQNLAIITVDQGHFGEAAELYHQAIHVCEKSSQTENRHYANALANLASLCFDLARYAEAAELSRQSLAIRERVLGANHLDVALSLNQLANIAASQGRFAQAEPLYRRALEIQERALGAEHDAVAGTLSNLASSYYQQKRYAEAEQLGLRAIAIRQKVLVPDHLDLSDSLSNLGNIYADSGQHTDADVLYRKALAIVEKRLGKDNPRTLRLRNNIALLAYDQARYDEAAELFKQVIAECQRLELRDDDNLPTALGNLALVYLKQEKFAEAEPLIDQAIAIRERAIDSPATRADNYLWRARIRWGLGRKQEAFSDLHRAIELVEEQRAQASGGEFERATLFAGIANSFEQMVAWQLELGDMNEALSAMERSRARSLLEEMNVGGVDLSFARTDEERRRFQAQESELNTRIAELEVQAASASAGAARGQLDNELNAARAALYHLYREERTSNPLYRDLISVGAKIPQLAEVQRVLTAGDALVLTYFLGSQGGYLLAFDSHEAKLTRLDVSPAQAERLRCEAGPLSSTRIGSILMRGDDQGIVQELAAQSADPRLASRLKTLWEVLVPAPLRAGIIGGKYQRLIVLPDGALSLLPFETLVVDDAQPTKYLLDVGPAIVCAPSATILYNLVQRDSASNPAPNAVLTVGDPAYAPTGANNASRIGSTGSRYRAAGGVLARLPYSGTESRWVSKNFAQPNVDVLSLFDKQATEKNVRAHIAGRALVHLACHGLTDQSFNNFFGALALAPGAEGARDANDDGFLSLPEIYALDLKRCELAILSACQTNYGPQQKGEGIWALSRGFLIAGSRRVVASNWLVDDEAAASLVSYFTAGIAQEQKQGNPLSYAESLHAAKRWVRQQEKWQHPYYWGTFVLIGPN